MRRVLAAVTLVVACAMAGTVPAGADPSAGVVKGEFWYESAGIYSQRAYLHLTFTGITNVGGSAYRGAYTVTGHTDSWLSRSGVPSPWPQPMTGTLPLTGSNDDGDLITGTCGGPGSEFRGDSAATEELVLVCTAGVNGGTDAPLTITVRPYAITPWPPFPVYAVPFVTSVYQPSLVGLFTT